MQIFNYASIVKTCKIIRRVKSAHGIHAQHKATEGKGPDGSTYIFLKLHGSKATIHIELMEDEA